jgi:hypothetical protein
MINNNTEDSGNNNVETLSIYFDNTLGNLQTTSSESGTNFSDIEDLLNPQDKIFQTSAISPAQSHSDLEMDYSGDLNFEDNLPGPLESDGYPSSCSESSELSEHESHDEHNGLTKKYRQPSSLKAVDLSIGYWRLNDSIKIASDLTEYNLEVKFLFGRRKIKYEISQKNSKKCLLIDYDFTQLMGLKLDPNSRVMEFLLSEPPNFSSKERGKCNKIPDFTEGTASKYQRHVVLLSPNINCEEQFERLLQSDQILKQLSEVSFSPQDSVFDNAEKDFVPSVCDWDKENSAIIYCESCNASFCEDCDDVLHRHSTRKSHKRSPILNQIPKPKKSKKRRKGDRCRCGTGATKGTLGNPCTGTRCPCFSNGKNCSNCGCKNCNNPFKKPSHPRSSILTGNVTFTQTKNLLSV